MQKLTPVHNTPIQLKLPPDAERLIEPDDPIYAFNEVMEHVGLGKYAAHGDAHRRGRSRYDPEKLLKAILFAFMKKGYVSFSEIEKCCKPDIRQSMCTATDVRAIIPSPFKIRGLRRIIPPKPIKSMRL